jgi:hypothetical protein
MSPAKTGKSKKDRIGAGRPPTIAIDKWLVNDCVRYCAELDLLYLNNPKCGCTTVKHGLWLASDAVLGRNTFNGNVHDRDADPFARDLFRLPVGEREGVRRATVFSVVRNPFARAVSAYVDKVANDPGVWPFFLKRFGLKANVGKKELPFADFMRLIAVAHDDLLDGHFRPQHRNLLLPLAKPVFVGFVENMAPVGKFLRRHGVAFRNRRMNATHASEQLNRYYDSDSVALVRERYAEDFKRFGYSTDPAKAHASPSSGELAFYDGSEDPLLRWIATGRASGGLASETETDFLAFKRTRDAEKKLRILRRAFAGEHNWSWLRQYANFARRKSRDRQLADSILDRMMSLRRRYLRAVNAPSLFVEFAGRDADE